MQIKNSGNREVTVLLELKKIILSFINTKLKRNITIVFLLGSLILMSSAGSFLYGVWMEKSKGLYNYKLLILTSKPVSIPLNYLKGFFADPEKISIDIKFENYQKLAYQRQLALSYGEVVQENQDVSVPAQISHDGKSYRVKMRLSGGVLDHVATEKWSFKINVKGDNTIFGMREFSIRHPFTRKYFSTWICNKMNQLEGFAALRYDFIDVTINGYNKGIYILEEGFDKRLVENSRFREGLLFRSDKTLQIFNRNKALEEPASAKQVVLLDKLYADLLDGILPPDKIFNYPRMARFVALIDLVKGHHLYSGGNSIFYFNPVTGLIEPIGREWDSTPYNPLEFLYVENIVGHDAIKILMNDPGFLKLYLKELVEISKTEYLDNFYSIINDEMQEKLNILYMDYPHYNYPKEFFYENQAYIRSKIYALPGDVRPYLMNTAENKISINVKNKFLFPIEVIGLSFNDSLIFEPEQNVIIREKGVTKADQLTEVVFNAPSGVNISPSNPGAFKLLYKSYGLEKVNEEYVFNWDVSVQEPEKYDLVRSDPNHSSFDFFVTNEASKTITLKPGKWIVDRNLIIPPGYTVTASSATTISLDKSASIISFSPLNFSGSQENPIIITSTDSTGYGIVVLNAITPSYISNTNFINLGAPESKGWAMTGAVTFYESPVHFNQAKFLSNRSEDGLNIIRSEFSIESSYFAGASSDAFDADFCSGTIKNTSFVNCENDGIDVSGSDIIVENVIMKNIGDKGISSGEDSRISAVSVKVFDSAIAIASKDKSILEISDLELNKCDVGFTVFQKKSEFGGALITANRVTIISVDQLYLIESNSSMTVDGKQISPTHDNVSDILYGVVYGKKTVR